MRGTNGKRASGPRWVWTAAAMCAVLLAMLSVTAYAVSDWTESFESGQGSWGMTNGTWATAAAPAGGDGSGLAFYDQSTTTALWANRAISPPDGGSTRIKVSCDFYTATTITASSRAQLWVCGSTTTGANNQMFRIGTYNNAHYICQYYAGGVGTIDTGLSGSIGWHKISILFDKANKLITWKFDNAWGTYGNANYGTWPTYVLLGSSYSNGGGSGAHVYFDNVVLKQLGPAPTKPTAPVPANGAANVPTSTVLSWTAGTGALSYDVYLGTNSAALSKVSSAQTGTSYTDSLVTGTTYYWRVDSLDADGNPTVGDIWMFTTPGNLTVTSAHGLCLGSGDYAAGTNASVTVTPDAGYAFMKWSTKADGSDTVSTLRSFTYTMPTPVPPAGITLYAIMEARASMPDIVVESRSGGQNYDRFSDSGGTTWADSGAKSLAAGLTSPGSRYSSISTTLFGAGRYAQYAPDIAVAGTYAVYATWPQSTNGCRYVTHEVSYAGGGKNFSLWNQNQDAPSVTYGDNGPSPVGAKMNLWNPLGTFAFDVGTVGSVRQYSLVPDMRGDPPASVRLMADAVKFQFCPPKAINPTPVDGAFKVTKNNPVLSWQSGGSTVAYDVYFGTTPATLTKVSSLQGGTSYTCGTLVEATLASEPTQKGAYCWRIDSINNGTTTGDVWSFVTEGPAGSNYLTVRPNPAGFGVCTGAGYYMPATTAHVTTTVADAAKYQFLKWTSDLAGNNTVSTNAAFDYTVSSADAALYAQYKLRDYNVTVVANPSAGGLPTVDGGASHGYSTSVAVHAGIPTDGYCFVNWSTNADGTGVVSRKPDYTFTMPAADRTLYANYAKALFVEGFEGLVSGSALGHGTLAMNYTNGDNQATNGDLTSGNAWWGTTPANASVGVDPDYTGATAHAGSNAAWDGKSPGGRDYVNLAYRTNNADFGLYGVYVDWWFYDPLGTDWSTGTDGGYCDDPLSLGNLSGLLSGPDYDSVSADFSDTQFDEKLSLGMADDWCEVGAPPNVTYTQYAGFDPTKYQARIKAGIVDTGTPYANGWYNLGVARSVGWHHARIVCGSRGDDWSNAVRFYVDDMSNPALTGKTWSALNILELASQSKPGPAADTSVVKNSKGAMYDDIVVGFPNNAPSAPTAAAATGITANAVTWNWTPAGAADGYRLYDAATLGARKGPDVSSPTCAETGLVANTQYSRWAVAFNNAVFESARTALTPVYTLAAVPALGTNVATTASAGGFYSPSTWPGFTNPQTFGTGNKVSSFKYKWSTSASDSIAEGAGTSWTTDGMTTIPASDGTYYLYLRSYNFAGVGNGSTKIGAFVFDSAVPTGASVVINGGAATTSTIGVTLALSATDSLSGMDKMSFSNDNVAWSTPEAYGTSKSWNLSADGGLKTVYVKFTDKAGNSSVASDTITFEDATAVAKISDLWPLSNGPAYKLTDKVVTGVVGGAFWIEERDRSAAIKVVYSGTVNQNQRVDVTGVLDSSSGQRVLVASSVTEFGFGAPVLIKPLVVVERAMGGKGINADTPAIVNGSGLYNIGMLVRIAGSVGFAGANFFYLDDGSGLTDGANMGIKVLCGAVTPPASGTKTVTGLVGVEGGKPVLIIRGIGDIQ